MRADGASRSWQDLRPVWTASGRADDRRGRAVGPAMTDEEQLRAELEAAGADDRPLDARELLLTHDDDTRPPGEGRGKAASGVLVRG